jgi:hypothetical protein
MSKHNEVPKIEVNCRFSLKLVWSLNSRSISASRSVLNGNIVHAPFREPTIAGIQQERNGPAKQLMVSFAEQ